MKYQRKWSWRVFFKSKLQDSVQLQTVMALYEQEDIQNNEQPSYSRLQTAVRCHIDETRKTRNFRARNEIVERGAVSKSHKGRKSQRGEESGRMLSVESILDSVRKVTRVVSVTNSRLETDAGGGDEKNNRLLLPLKRRHRLTGRNPQKVQASEEKVFLEQEERFRAEIS